MEKSVKVALLVPGAVVVIVAGFSLAEVISRGPHPHNYRKHTEVEAQMLRTAVQHWHLATERYDHCPTRGELVGAQIIDPSEDLKDPWGHPFKVECLEDDIVVTSAGSDGKFGTVDDVGMLPSRPLS